MSKTGYFVRIKRDGKFQKIDVAELDDAELGKFFTPKEHLQLRDWACCLAQWIRNNVEERPA